MSFDCDRLRRCAPAIPILWAALALSGAGCSSSVRRLDPVFSHEKYKAEMKFHYQTGTTDPGILRKIVPGDIIAFSAKDPSSASSVVFGIALSQVGHVAIVLNRDLLVLSADSERGVTFEGILNCIQGRPFYVFSFPQGLLDLERLELFAKRAYLLGRGNYNWSAIFGWNSNLTPNALPEVGDEYTCATAVAAALHFSGLSLDRAWWGVVTPGDIIFSYARRNLNGPDALERERNRSRRDTRDREAEMLENLR